MSVRGIYMLLGAAAIAPPYVPPDPGGDCDPYTRPVPTAIITNLTATPIFQGPTGIVTNLCEDVS